MMTQRPPRRFTIALGLLLPAMVAGHVKAGELHMRESTPAAHAIVHGRHAEYVIRFDGPVDHTASRMEILRDGQVIRSLTPLADSAVDVLFASSETPPPGQYQLHWRAVAPDGMVSAGDIAFSVAP